MKIAQLIFCLFCLLSVDVKSHGDLHQQIDKLTVTIEQTPTVAVLLKRAQLFVDDTDLAQAWQDIKAARNISPEHPEVLYLGAKIALRSKRLKIALSLANQLLRIAKKPAESIRAYTLLSDIHLVKNQSDKALFYLKRSLHLQLKPLPNHWLKLADLQLKHEGYLAALSSLKRGVLQSGASVTLQQKIVAIAEKHKDYKSALVYIDQQLENATSLRELILLVKKFKLLLLQGDKNKASVIKQKARLVFRQLPEHKKNIPIAQAIKSELN